jgi:hypothetical protein
MRRHRPPASLHDLGLSAEHEIRSAELLDGGEHAFAISGELLLIHYGLDIEETIGGHGGFSSKSPDWGQSRYYLPDLSAPSTQAFTFTDPNAPALARHSPTSDACCGSSLESSVSAAMSSSAHILTFDQPSSCTRPAQ